MIEIQGYILFLAVVAISLAAYSLGLSHRD